MKKSLLSLFLIAVIGCTSAQLQIIENDIHKATTTAQSVIQAYKNNQATIAEVQSALAALAPKTGAAHQAVLNAQAALIALQNSQGTIEEVQNALAIVEAATASPVGSGN